MVPVRHHISKFIFWHILCISRNNLSQFIFWHILCISRNSFCASSRIIRNTFCALLNIFSRNKKFLGKLRKCMDGITYIFKSQDKTLLFSAIMLIGAHSTFTHPDSAIFKTSDKNVKDQRNIPFVKKLITRLKLQFLSFIIFATL